MEILTREQITRLSSSERLELIGQLWDGLEREQLPLTDAQQEELDRRLNSLERDRREGITWTALRAELEQRCP